MQEPADKGLPISAVGIALGLFTAWAFATWLLEGRTETLLRPEALADRARYALIANLLIGIFTGVAVLRFLVRGRWVSVEAAGFGPSTRSVVQMIVALGLGVALYLVQGAPSLDAVVLLNAFSQVLVVSAAEVVVCWAVVGSTIEALVKPHGKAISVIGATAVASILFGIYHFAHSPPFNTIGMVALLTVVGLVTSAFFFIGRNIYATILFHSFLGLIGVVQALLASGQLNAFQALQPPLLVMALATIAALAASDLILLRSSRSG